MAAGQAELNMKPGDTSYADVLERVGWASGKASNPLGGYRGPKSGDILDAIHVGDRVTVVNRFGQERTGRAVMRGLHGWVLNMGGAHGTPKVADNENIVRVGGKGAGKGNPGNPGLPEGVDASDVGKAAWKAWMRRERFEARVGNWGGLQNNWLNIKIEADYRGGPESIQLWVTSVEGGYVKERARISGRTTQDERKLLKAVSTFIATGHMDPVGKVSSVENPGNPGTYVRPVYMSHDQHDAEKLCQHLEQHHSIPAMVVAREDKYGRPYWIVEVEADKLDRAAKVRDDWFDEARYGKRNPSRLDAYTAGVLAGERRRDITFDEGAPSQPSYGDIQADYDVYLRGQDSQEDTFNDFRDGFREGYLTKGRIRNRKSNPESEAAEMYETFHGTPSTEVIEVEEDFHYHSNLAVLGTATELIVKVRRRGNMKISFDGHTKLCSNEEGTQLYLIDGDQSLNLRDIGIKRSRKGPHGDVTDVKDKILVGEIIELTYRTKKSFDNFKLTDYYHGLGEDSGVRPSLVYDVLNKHLEIVGGQYKVHDVGIVN